jgi:hypothetical protein
VLPRLHVERTLSEARDILDRYLARTGLRHPADAAQQFQVALLRGWIDHLDEVLDASHVPPQLRLTIIREFCYGAVPQDAEAELRTAMHKDMTYWAKRAAPDPAVLAGTGLPPSVPGPLPDYLQRYSVVRCQVCGVVARSHRGGDHPWAPDPEEKAAVDAKAERAMPGLDPGVPPDRWRGDIL